MKELEVSKKTIMVGSKKQQFIVIKPTVKKEQPSLRMGRRGNPLPAQSPKITKVANTGGRRKPCGGCSRRRAKKGKRG